MKEPEWDIRGDVEWGTIPGMIDAVSDRHPARAAIVEDSVTLSYAELSQWSKRVARALLSRGVEPADRVAVWLPNRWEWIAAAIGAQRIGAALVPVNTRFKGQEAAYVLEHSRSVAVVTSSDFLGTDYAAILAEVTANAPLSRLRTVVAVGDAPPSGGAMSWDEFVGWGDGTDSTSVVERQADVTGEDLSDILFTSGTTGHPKGVMCTHAQTLRAYRDWSEIVGLRADDRYLIVNPFFHGFGYKAGWLSALMMGATIYPMATLDIGRLLELVEQHRITVLPGSPTLYQTMLADPRLHDRDLSSLRLSVTGAAVVPIELIRRMRAQLTFQIIITGYGLTESGAITTMSRADDSPETIASTAGRPIPGTEVVVVDDNGDVVIDQPGDVLVRGYNVMLGYYDDDDATAAAIDPEGWLRTGDVGVMNADGYLKITDRKKDMYIVGGFNAYPAEIENMILEHSSVSQVALVGVPDDRMGEVGMAFVMPLPGEAVDPDDLIEWCRGRMANFKVPRYVQIVDSLPLNPAGKVLKGTLREQARTRLGLPVQDERADEPPEVAATGRESGN